MALILTEPLIPDKTIVSLPATITFRAGVQDIFATRENPINHTVHLVIVGNNDLSFGQAKSAPCTTAVGPQSTPIGLTLTVNGTGAGLLNFKVSLRDNADAELDSCTINLTRA